MREQFCFRINDRSKCITWLDVIVFLFFARVSAINFLSFLHIPTFLTAGGILVSLVCFLLLFTAKHWRQIKWDGIFLIIGIYLFFKLTLQVHPEYSRRFLDVYNEGRFAARGVFVFGAGIYGYYIVRLCEDKLDRLYQLFQIVPYVIGFGNIVLIFNRDSAYRMDFGYHMSLAAILFIGQFLYTKKISSFFLSAFFILLGILYGSRACIIGYVVFIFVYMLWDRQFSLRKLFLGVSGCVAALLVSSQTAMMGIYKFFLTKGFDSRTLYKLATGSISSDNARQDHLWPILIRLLKRSSFTKMYGAFGDRYYLPDYYPYAHNIALEMLLTFGKLLGGVIILFIAVSFLWVIFRQKNKAGMLTLAFGCFSFCRLMVSTSFWTEPFFWAYLAMVVNLIKCSKKRKTATQILGKKLFPTMANRL